MLNLVVAENGANKRRVLSVLSFLQFIQYFSPNIQGEDRLKTIVITGASSGIGGAAARYFAAQDWKVAATMRKPENATDLNDIENVTLYPLDVTEQASIDRAAMQILRIFETVDVVLNNAGCGLAGPFESITPDQIRW